MGFETNAGRVTTDYFIRVASGAISGQGCINKFGWNPAIASGATEEVVANPEHGFSGSRKKYAIVTLNLSCIGFSFKPSAAA